MTEDFSHLGRDGKGVAPPTEAMKRDGLGLWMLAAFNGVEPAQFPKSDSRYTHFANESMAKAWGNVATVARAWVMAELLAARAYPAAVEALARQIETRLVGVKPEDQDLELEDHDWLLILTALRKCGAQRDITQPAGTFSDLFASGPLPPSAGDPSDVAQSRRHGGAERNEADLTPSADCSPRLSPCGTFAIHAADCVTALERGMPREGSPQDWPKDGEGPFRAPFPG